MTSPSLTVAPAEDGDRLRALLDEFYAGRRGHPSWAAQEVQLLMAEGGPLATLLSDHASALSAERARVEAVEAALAAMTAERDRLTAEVARKDAALRPFAHLASAPDVLTNHGVLLQYAPDDCLACGLNIPVAHLRAARATLPEVTTPITDGETDA